LLWAAAAVLLAVAALVLLATRHTPAADKAPAQVAAAAPVAAQASAATVAVPLAAPTRHASWPRAGWLAPPGAGTPATPALTLAELRELQATLAAAPHAGGEQAAAAEAMFFADAAQRFHQVLSTGQEAEAGELRALAQMLDAALDKRLLQGDVNWPDARLVKAALLQVLRPQDAAHQEQVEDWEIRLRQGPLRAAQGQDHPPP
jgi:hypothetical protein